MRMYVAEKFSTAVNGLPENRNQEYSLFLLLNTLTRKMVWLHAIEVPTNEPVKLLLVVLLSLAL